jgi:hypothetical protein
MANLVFGSYDITPYYAIEGILGTSGNVYGTSSAGGFGFIPYTPTWSFIDSGVQMLDPSLSKNSMEIWSLDGFRDPKFNLYMEKKYDFPITYYPSDINFLSLGITSVNASFAIEEVWNPQAGTASNKRYYRYVGCMVDELDITWKIGRPIEVKASIFFQKEWYNPATNLPVFPDTAALSGATYGSEPSAVPFLFSDTPIQIDPLDTGAQTGTFSNLNVLAATLKIQNKRDRPNAYALGQTYVTQLPLGRRHIEGTIQRLFEDQDQVDQFEDTLNSQQGTAFEIKYPLGTVHYIKVLNAKWDPLKTTKDVSRDLLVYTYTFKGYQPAAGGNQLSLA